MLINTATANEIKYKNIIKNNEGIFLPKMSAKKISLFFDKFGYDLEQIKKNKQDVPKIFVTSVPSDMNKITDVRQKKDLFFKMILPLILKANKEVIKERTKLLSLEKSLKNISSNDKKWLDKMSRKYQVSSKRENPIENMKMRIGGLKIKIDAVSPSLSLTQAAIESAWGTSRFAKLGNALFGEWTWDGTGIIPKGREKGERHSVKKFKTMYGAVKSYINNTNRNRAYEIMWTMRSERRKAKKTFEGYALASSMIHYSQRGMGYVNTIRSIIKGNNLFGLDNAKLDDKNTFDNFKQIVDEM
jgi:Bax protein